MSKMADEPLNIAGSALAASPTAQANVMVVSAPPVVESPPSVEATRKPVTLKKLAWRTTAAVFWAWWLVRALLGDELINRIASLMVTRLSEFLSAIGFAPVHSEHLPKMLQVGWLLALVGFKPFELLGLYVYIRLAPLTLLGYLVFKEYGKDLSVAEAEKKGLRPPKIRRPALTTVSLMLLGWFMLYGDASAPRALMAGAMLSGLLLLLLAARAFQRVKPPRYPDGSEPASAFERVAFSMSTSSEGSIKQAMNAKKKSELVGNLFVYRQCRSIWRRYALFIRGQGGRDKLYLLLLVDYVVSLLVLGAAAVLFWAVIAKLATAPSAYSLTEFARVCSSYFLPNIKPPSLPIALAPWVQIGTSITAFILFVLFVGAAASLLPLRFAAYTERLNRKYRIARKFSVSFARTVRALERIRLSKPR